MIDWNSFNTWQLVMPPSRPDINQLMRLRLLLRGIDPSQPVGILGSTPEFRDVCHEMGFRNVYVFDKNISFYRRTKDMMVWQDASENLVEGDWIETLPEFRDFFSVILSDLTMGNIAYECRDIFYEVINNALRKEGIFIDKVLMHNHFLKVDQLLCEYKQKPLNLQTANTFNCQMLFCSELVGRRHIVDTSAIYMFLNGKEQCEWMRPLLDLTRKITPEGCIWYYGKKRDIVEKSYISHFKVLNIWEEPGASPYYTFVQHYLMGKRI